MNEQNKNIKIALPTQQKLKQHLANDRLKEVIHGLLVTAEATGYGELHDDTVLLSAQLEQYQREQRLGSMSYERLFITKSQIGRGLLDLVNLLPKDLPTVIATGNKISIKTKSISESRLKKLIFLMTIASKAIVFGYIIFHWQTGGFTKNETFATISILLPLFAAFLTLMLREFIIPRNKFSITQSIKKRVSKKFQWITLGVFFVHIWLLSIIIGAKPEGTLSFEEMNIWIALIECGFAIYVGEIVFELFKRRS